MINSAEQHITDQHNHEQYTIAEHNLRQLATLLNDLATETHADRPAFYTFAEPVRNLWQKQLEDMAVRVHAMAEDALDLAVVYGSLAAEHQAAPCDERNEQHAFCDQPEEASA